MCVAILQKPGKTITQSQITDFSCGNRDGFGIAYIDNKSIKLYHTLDLIEFRNAYKDLTEKYGKTEPMLVHFRASTGGNGIENCHPFDAGNNIAFIHNGHISNVEKQQDKSDTNVFNETIIKPISEYLFTNEETISLLNDFIGTYNKVVFLRGDGSYLIFNENNGHWDDDIWYSTYSKQNYPHYNSTNRSVIPITYECDCCGIRHYESFIFKIVRPRKGVLFVCEKCVELGATIIELMPEFRKNYSDY